MSLAKDIFEKMAKEKQVKGEPESLPLEKPIQLPQAPVVDPIKGDQPEPGTPGPLFGRSIEVATVATRPIKIFSKLFLCNMPCCSNLSYSFTNFNIFI